MPTAISAKGIQMLNVSRIFAPSAKCSASSRSALGLATGTFSQAHVFLSTVLLELPGGLGDEFFDAKEISKEKKIGWVMVAAKLK